MTQSNMNGRRIAVAPGFTPVLRGSSQNCRGLAQGNFFYALTCEFCISHHLAALWPVLMGYRLVFEGCRGYLAGLEIQRQRLGIEEEKRQLGDEHADAPLPR